MSKTTFLGYVPSLKSKHEATIVGHKAIKSKGGSIRYTLQGEYDGRKTLPKTVSKADFESVYGFDAKAAEAVIIAGYVEDAKGNIKEQGKIKGFIKNVRDNDGYVPTAITHVDNPNHKGIKDYTDNHNSSKLPAYSMWADTVGNPSLPPLNPLHLRRVHSRKNRQMKTFQHLDLVRKTKNPKNQKLKNSQSFYKKAIS